MNSATSSMGGKKDVERATIKRLLKRLNIDAHEWENASGSVSWALEFR